MKIGVYLFTGAPVDIHSVMGHLFSKTCSFAASFTSHGGFSFLLSASLSPVPYYHGFFHPHFNCGRNCGTTSNIIRSCFWGRGYPIGTGGASLLLESSSYGKLFQSLRRCSAVHTAWGSSATRLSGAGIPISGQNTVTGCLDSFRFQDSRIVFHTMGQTDAFDTLIFHNSYRKLEKCQDSIDKSYKYDIVIKEVSKYIDKGT